MSCNCRGTKSRRETSHQDFISPDAIGNNYYEQDFEAPMEFEPDEYEFKNDFRHDRTNEAIIAILEEIKRLICRIQWLLRRA